ncbi:hypothetical protein DL89DRAFT_257257 [Linderina pennispora]|uniref:Protein kinase domain-containing protein n=1 Tax=Linderina pennispora TaxID=61395 RepID=A0A1Y1W8W6_9FUNG|nr:uncharacterized protein DL89DRAFT_257257 [Linderina pennispora]ORX69959.1 hypothetical protein DL89DRAFT_257257 [Linderina pennispora]
MHAKGVVHSNINKFNIAVNEDDTLRLIDFGHSSIGHSSVATDVWDGPDINSKGHDKAVQNLIGSVARSTMTAMMMPWKLSSRPTTRAALALNQWRYPAETCDHYNHSFPPRFH